MDIRSKLVELLKSEPKLEAQMSQGALQRWKQVGHFDVSQLPEKIEIGDNHCYGDLWDDKGAYEGIVNGGRNSDGFGRYVTPEGVIREGLFRGSL